MAELIYAKKRFGKGMTVDVTVAPVVYAVGDHGAAVAMRIKDGDGARYQLHLTPDEARNLHAQLRDVLYPTPTK